jgi:hypothetical protein
MSLKSFEMEYFGWKTLFGGAFINNTKKQILAVYPKTEFLSRSCIVRATEDLNQ